MSMKQDTTVAKRIRQEFENLTRAEKQLANTLLDNYPVLGLSSITTAAETADVSTPTVVRMSKKLGFSGFQDLQSALRDELEHQIASPLVKHERWARNVPNTHILNLFADAISENMRHTLQQMDLDDFDQVAQGLADSDRCVHIVGGRITRALADYLFTHLQVIRKGVTKIASNSNTWPHYVLNMEAGDILVMFDIRRYEQDILKLAQMASDKQVTLILFTDQWGSPAARYATHCFYARIEAPSAWDSTIMIQFIIESLIAAVEALNSDDAKQRLNMLEDLFDHTALFRKFK